MGHDDCSDLYPGQLDDNWLAVTDDKKPKKKSGSGAVAKAVESLKADNDNPMTADDTWDCQGAGGRCDESSESSKSSKSTKSEKKTGATESGADDAVNCSTHDDCSDLYPGQLDDNWLAVTDDKKPKKKSSSGSNVAKAAKSLKADNDNPMTADDEWNCQGASGRCDESSSTSTTSSKSKSKAAKGTKTTAAGSDDAVNCSTHDDCNDLYPDQLDDNCSR